MADDITNTPAEGLLRERFARGEIDAEEYERSLAVLGSGGSGTGRRGAKRSRFLIAGLATAALLTAGGAGVAYAHGDGQQGAGEAAAGATTNGGDMGSMMGGGDMGSMMGNGGGMGSMMGGEGGGQMMGSFDENKPFDLQFIDQMTMHHEGAIMSSEHMIGDSERPELRQLAESIQKSQSEQIKQMQGFREEWYADAEQTSGMPAGMMDQMMGDGTAMRQMMGGSMQEVMGGDVTDEMFLRMMIPHHQMAVDMANRALDGSAEHPELAELARTIRDEQSAEIELMKGYLNEIEQTDR
ncbi:MAG: DUF305 domain-containing protein [Actinomycetota bacterium]|nr:DUF305 domain-containing protein [Actinomycetota bacterium]